MYAHLQCAAWVHRKRGHLDLLHPVHGSGAESCRRFCSVLGHLQTVQRAELWSVILALQDLDAVHVGLDNLNVVGHVSRIVEDMDSVRLCVLMDGSKGRRHGSGIQSQGSC